MVAARISASITAAALRGAGPPPRQRLWAMRIGFLFNHDQVHQVAHSLPIALALAASGLDAEIVVATTNARLAAEVKRLGGDAIGRGITLVPLELRTRRSRFLAGTLEHLVPATKLLIYGDNLDFFRSLDMLVVAEKTSLVLKTRYGLGALKIVHTRHGAGDRAIGFDKASNAFDHVLVSGEKIRARLVGEAGVDPNRISIVGYPKFDIVPSSPRARPASADERPVVLYNPHVSPHLSSWFRMGRQVLDWFAAHEEYQLIFAPHVMLFERPFALSIDKLRIDRPGRIAQRYLRAPNIHFDLGSRASTTMAYTEQADIYLGDVSSQVYEFLRRPRPCVFLNAHSNRTWATDPNFACWHAGSVIDDPAALGPALADAADAHARTFRNVQETLFASSFDLGDRPSSQRAAEVLLGLLGIKPLPKSALSRVAA